MNKKNWLQTLIGFMACCKWKIICSVICAIISVFGGLIPYFAVYKIIILFIQESPNKEEILSLALISLLGYAIKLIFHTISTILSHMSAYTILEAIRLKVADKLMKAPL